MATCSLAELLAQAQANCFTCIGDQKLFQGLVLQLLCNISENGGGGGGSQTPWTSDIDAAGFNLNNLGLINGVKVYRALMTQTGTNAPVVTVLENSIGAIVWAYDSVGTYLGTLVGAFPINKVWSIAGQRGGGTEIEIGRNGDDQMFIETRGFDSGVPSFPQADDILQFTSIEIRVYP
jgi:hypothetical protein